MPLRSLYCLFGLVLALSSLSWGQDSGSQYPISGSGHLNSKAQPENSKVPTGVILVRGAWSSASDSLTVVPEGGEISNHVYRNQYFGMTYPLPPDWVEKYKGPPPSESGRYVLAQISPADSFVGSARGNILITAQDTFFAPLPAANVPDLINYSMHNLPADYKVEMPPKETRIAGHSFTVSAYWSPLTELHWYGLATQIRCHVVEFAMTSRDKKLLETLIQDMNHMQLSAEADLIAGTGRGDVPVCIKDYASGENVIARVDPVFTEHRFNGIPVRIIIDKEGKIKHIHFLSAFPDQVKAISDALAQWKFTPYVHEGRPAEVETGLMFGRRPLARTPRD
jgi:hypothetical protein